VDVSAIAALEFPAVLDRLAAEAQTPYGVERALELQPALDEHEVARRQRLTTEAIALLDEAAEPPLHGVRDIRGSVDRAPRGGILTPAALADVAATIDGALRARQSLQAQELAPELRDLAVTIEPSLARLADEIRHAVEEDGSGVRDTATPDLRRLRRELRAGRARVEAALERMARSTELRSHLQETFIVQRGGRPVLAVKAGSRASVPGVVHDASGSGQTLFVEPLEVLELNNRQSEAAAAEREEVERILRELSQAVGGEGRSLAVAVDALGELDLAVASGALSRAWSGTPVTIGAQVRLLAARHPLLDRRTVVPIDLDLGALRAVVVSGPNTGGKTVALKTLGLAVLLHQSGLRPPAVEAELPIFDAVLVEIGDQQSLEMSLSTFSAHIRNLIAILETATDRSLVLVDELAAGTDPVEGAALAQALLERFARQARLTVATTHYGELKAWASATEGALNAATLIDPDTNEPLYRLVLGRAGTSHALPTAERLGLDPAVVEAARGSIAPERQRIDALLAEAQAAEQSASAERTAAAVARRDAEDALARARRSEAALAAEIERVRVSAAEERERAIAATQADLAAARGELDALRAEVRAARRRQREVERGRTSEGERDRRLGDASERAARAERALEALREPVVAVAPLAAGDPVVAPALGVRGTIVSIDGEEAEVVGSSGQRVRIALARLQPEARREPEPPPVRVRATVAPDAADEVDVRGRSAQEAREAARALVDEGSLAGLREVRIVHGRGTGALKNAVREELRKHPLVHELRPEAADGATVAVLDE
jgi:DNA mismatch repair protein MutS2